ncbi:MAG TPA: DUF1800 family protein [Pyrinomonadaceae bacterium]|nr:DUF1800 family protein [Pyrinomonadaceae bacterium]
MKNRASCLRRRFRSVVCAGLAVFASSVVRPVSAAPQKSPVLYSVSGSSTRAVVLESVSFVSEPFSLNMEVNFSPSDPRTRITLFGTDFEFLQGEGANALSADAQDGTGTIYPLKVEYVGTVPNFPGVYMVVLRLNDLMTSSLGDVLVRLNLHGMASNRVRVAIGQIGGGPPDDSGAVGTPAPSTPPAAVPPLTPPTYGPNDPTVSVADIRRLLEQATWGPVGDGSDVTHIQQVGMRAWLDEQFTATVLNPAKGSDFPDLPLVVDDPTTQCGTDAICQRDNYSGYPIQKQFFTNSLTRNTQLRQRVAWALHQIFVVSQRDVGPAAWWMVPYLQALDRNAFGNYRTLLNDITLNPAMGSYLDMRLSQANNPNENYAREVLQLFSVGINQLNSDGTPVVDSQGKPLPTYTQTNVNEFTRLFTGWNWQAAIQQGMTNYRDPMLPRGVNGTHDTGAKTLFNGTNIPACTSTTGAQNAACAQSDLTAGLDNIFNHSNVGPFISRQLIQHLVTSNPSPGYVQRVASVFNSDCNGLYPESPCGARGNLKAVVRNILLDPEARGDFKTDPNYGKLREPVQYINNILRAFNASSDGVIGSRNPASGGDMPAQLDEPVFQPTTVFSYYMPDYEVPGTKILGPAFQILSTSTTLRRANVANTLIYSGIPVGANTPTGTQLNFTSLDALASGDTSGGQLVDQLNALLLHGTMSTQMRSSILTAVLSVPTSDGNFARKRVQTAVYLVVTAPQYDVQR